MSLETFLPAPAPTSLWHDVVSSTRSRNNKDICDLSSHSSKPYTIRNSPVCASLPTLSSEKLHRLSFCLLLGKLLQTDAALSAFTKASKTNTPLLSPWTVVGVNLHETGSCNLLY